MWCTALIFPLQGIATFEGIPIEFDRRKFAFSIIVRAELVQDGVAQRLVYITPDLYPELQWRVSVCMHLFSLYPHRMVFLCWCGTQLRPQLVGADGWPIAAGAQAQWQAANATAIPCDAARFFAVKDIIDSLLLQLDNSSGAAVAEGASQSPLAQLDVLNFQDAWAGCVAATSDLLLPSTITVQLTNSTLCTPELTAADDPCCSLDGLWTRCCVPRTVELTVQAYPERNLPAVASPPPALSSDMLVLTSI